MKLDLQMTLEALLFVSDQPLAATDIAVLLEVPAATVDAELESMAAEWDRRGRGVRLRKAGGGWSMITAAEAAPYLERFVAEQAGTKLSQASLETLAIVAYRQPVSRTQISQIRGVNCDRVLRTLAVAGLIEEAGRDDSAGRAILYRTNQRFLEKLGLDSLDELPALDTLMPDAESVERMETGLGPGV